jgi:integrase
MKWPHLAPHSRASLADALATVTAALTRPAGRRPPAARVRAALYGHAFNPRRARADPVTAATLAWVERASLPVSRLADPQVTRAALDGLCTRLDGTPAAATTISRKRAVFHGALGYAVELGLLPANPIATVQWRCRQAAAAVHPAAVATPGQVRAILGQVHRTRPDLTTFFGCLYYAALRPEEAVALRRDDLHLPARGRATIIVSTACPRTGTSWTSTGTPHQARGLKHRPDGAIRVVPLPAALTRLLHWHLNEYGTAPDGRLFPGKRGGILSESSYGRTWHAARHAALGPELAATTLARRPYDLRHAALSLWLNATSAPAEVAARAGTSTRVLHDVYQHCLATHDDHISQQIDNALIENPAVTVRDSKRLPDRSDPDPVRHMSVNPPLARAQPTAIAVGNPASTS